MPKIDIDKIPPDTSTGYPPQFRKEIEGRARQRLGNAAGLTQFGVNICTLKPGAQSSQRHWHENEDEFVYVLEGEVVLCEDGGETVLKPGDAAGWKAGVPNGHCLINRSTRDAVFLEVGTRARDKATYPDIDMLLARPGQPRVYTKTASRSEGAKMANFSFDVDGDGIALITWDMAGRSMNVINVAVMEELSTLVETVASEAAIKGAVITSGKEAFCAGADLTLLERLVEMFKQMAKNQGDEAAAQALFDESRKLSLLYRRIETSGKPWAAAINGTALGGGFELALACHHRVAAQDDKTRLGLPEIKVGLFPGAGGTTRIARMLAPADALQLLLKGDQLKLDRAKAMKLIDAVVPPADLIKTAKDWIKAGGKAKAPWDVDGFRLPGGPVYSKAGMMMFPAANAIYRRETYDNYPAARAIMQVVYEGLQLPMDQALRVESRYFAKILRSPEAAAMIRTLFVSMQELNKGARRPPGVPPTQLRKIGIVGAGFMGMGIAQVTAAAGMPVVLVDRDQETADKGKAALHKAISDRIAKGRATTAERDALLDAISATADYGALKDCDLVIEAVFEDRKVKAEAIAKAEAVIGDNAIFASNTSTLPINSLAEEFKDQGKFIGIHFFSPVEKMMLVEIIVGKNTGDVALATALDFVRAIRKTPIVVNDSRGFYANRCVLNYLQEGHLMLLEGIPAAMIENVARMAGMPVGPLSLNDEVALDLSLRILRATEADLGPKAVNAGQRKLLEALVEKSGPARPQERQGFLRLSARRAEAAVAGARRPAAEKTDARPGRGDRRAGIEAPLPGGAGAGSRAHLRGGRRHRRARGRCRLDPRLRLCAVLRRHAVLHRHDGDQALRRAVQAAGEKIRRALRAVEAAARPGRDGRKILPPVCAATAETGGIRSDHHRQLLRRARDAGIEPALAAVGKREALVEQHDVVPLRALRLVDGQHIAVVELVVGLAPRPVELLDAAGEAFRPHRHLHAAHAAVVVRHDAHRHDAGLARAALLHAPQRAVEQALLAIVAQAHQLVAGGGQRLGEAAALAHARVVGAPRDVAADQHLIGVEHALRVEIVALDDFGFAVAAGLEIFAGADLHRQADDRIVLRLAVHLGEHHVGLGLGEEAAALDRRQLRRVAEHQHRHAERHQVAAELGVDHRALVDDDELGLGGRRLVPQLEARHFLAAFARAVDQAVDGGGAVAALAAHHQGGLAGEGGELHLAVDAFGDVARQRGLAGAGIAEQAEDRRRAVRAGLGGEPGIDGLERVVLLRGKFGHCGLGSRAYRKNKKELATSACPVGMSGICAFARPSRV